MNFKINFFSKKCTIYFIFRKNIINKIAKMKNNLIFNEGKFNVYGKDYLDQVNQTSLAKIEKKSNIDVEKLNKDSPNIRNNSDIISDYNTFKYTSRNNIIVGNNMMNGLNTYGNMNYLFNNNLNYSNINDLRLRSKLLFLLDSNKFPYNSHFDNLYTRNGTNNLVFNSYTYNNTFYSLYPQIFLTNNYYFNSFLNLINMEKEKKYSDNILSEKKETSNNKVLFVNDNCSSKLVKPKRPYRRHKIIIEEVNTDDNCFPFKTGKGIINTTSKLKNEEIKDKKEDENNQNSNIKEINVKDNIDKILNLNGKTYPNNDLYLAKFTTKKYYINANGKKRRIIKTRKYKPDIIRKKIKSRFHKIFKNIINMNLKKAGSNELFDFLQQSFLTNNTKKLNSKCFELTYEELILTDFTTELNKTNDYQNIMVDKIKYIRNKKVLTYLENNPNISKKSGFDIVKKMKYKDILSKYFISKEFEDSLNQLKKEKEEKEYIQTYILQAKKYIKFYSTDSLEKNNNEMDGNEEEEEDDDDYDQNDEDDD